MFCDVNLQFIELKFLPSATHNYFFVHSNALRAVSLTSGSTATMAVGYLSGKKC